MSPSDRRVDRIALAVAMRVTPMVIGRCHPAQVASVECLPVGRRGSRGLASGLGPGGARPVRRRWVLQLLYPRPRGEVNRGGGTGEPALSSVQLSQPAGPTGAVRERGLGGQV